MRRLAALAALVVLASACGGTSEPEQASPPPATVTGPGSEIAGESLEGEPLSLADFRGRRVLVNVWSSW